MALDQLAPAVARIACSDTIHTLLWRDGTLQAPDHADPDAERALAALGASPCRCVEVLDAWAQCATDPRVLVLGPRGSEAVPPVGEDDGPRRGSRPSRPLRQNSAVMYSAGGSRGPRANEPLPDPLLDCLTLGGVLPHRLVASAADALAGRTHEPELAAQLHAALFGRVLTALDRWMGALPELELEMIGPAEPPSLTLEAHTFTVRLPFDWIVNVWAPGLETVAGRFTLSAEPDGSGGWDLLGVDQTMAVSACKLAPQ